MVEEYYQEDDVDNGGWDDYEEGEEDQQINTYDVDMDDDKEGIVNNKKLYRMLTSDEVLEKIKAKADHIEDTLGISNTLAFSMLVRNSFGEQAAIDQFMDDPDYIEKTFKFQPVNKPILPLPEDFLCGICFCPCEDDEVIGIEDCGHTCCKECYSEYLKSRLTDGHESIGTYCPDQKCNMVVPESFFKQLLDEESYKRYRFFLMKAYVETNKNAQWCIGAQCSRVCELPGGGSHDIECEGCNSEYCYQCMKEPHQPLGCEEYKKWTERVCSDDGSQMWLKINTKPCPKCGTAIQKNQGCMFIQCTNCKYGFCWLCMKESNHRDMCSGFEGAIKSDKVDKNSLEDTLQMERELKRFEFYSTRYTEHYKSIAFSKKRLADIQDEIQQVSNAANVLSPNDMAFLIDIGKLNIAARKFVCLTYAFRFYLRGMNKQYFFDFMQKDLEKSLELITQKSEQNWMEYLEFDVKGNFTALQKFQTFKEEMISLRDTLENHFNSAFNSIRNGLSEVPEDQEQTTEEVVDHAFDGTNVGDWKCVICKENNHKTDQICRTCKAPKRKLDGSNAFKIK